MVVTDKFFVIDTHVHVHSLYNITDVLESAYSNFAIQARKYSTKNFMGVLFVYSLNSNDDCNLIFKSEENVLDWKFNQIDSNTFEALSGKKQLLIKTGYQVISSEGIEILVLADRAKEFFGVNAEIVIEKALSEKLLVILPWGVGKWLGKRGVIVNDLIKKFNSKIFLGDNSSRPWFWWRVPQFTLARSLNTKILQGTDPLSISCEERIIGTSGVVCRMDKLADLNLFDLLSNQASINYGHFESSYRFFINQIKIRLR